MSRSDDQTSSIVDFQKHRARRLRNRTTVLEFALDRCEESFRHANWEAFGYWFSVVGQTRIAELSPREPDSRGELLRS
jgi:hypothetical protein